MARYDFTTPRLFMTEALVQGAEITPAPGQAHYLINVLRLRAGGRVLLFNGADGEWLVEIAQAGKRACTLTVVSRTRAQTAPSDLHYLFAPLKRARLDYLVQKATEMGASLLQPVMTARTVSERVNVERMRANVVEAAEQCGILSVPEVRAPVKLAEAIAGWERGRRLILCDEDAPPGDPLAVLAKLSPGPLAVLVGPEGGFTEEERRTIRARPFVTVLSLGPRILRADTAAIAALTLVQAALGDLKSVNA
jgi:16S rRNA (uracil1498-N3)-methyltransferase